MKIIIFIVGLIILLIGTAFLAKPDSYKHCLRLLIKGKRIYLIAILRIILGVTFLIGALNCSYPPVLIFFGILFCLSGVLIFAMNPEKLKAVLNWFDQKGPAFIRALAILVLLVGAIIAYAA